MCRSIICVSVYLLMYVYLPLCRSMYTYELLPADRIYRYKSGYMYTRRYVDIHICYPTCATAAIECVPL